MAEIFTSHSHKNDRDAVYLQKVLNEHGAETFLDQDQIEPASVLPKQISDGIDWCSVFLLLWSRHAAKSSWVDREWNSAYEARKKIVPYLIDSCPLPSVLDNLVYISHDDRKHGHSGLLKGIFGKDYRPSNRSTIFPGTWSVQGHIPDGHVEFPCILELRSTGQVIGEGKMKLPSAIEALAYRGGVASLLNSEISLSGSWEYNDKDRLLTLSLDMRLMGYQPETQIINIATSGQDEQTLYGKDIRGKVWTLERIS